ncbi:unnamed protein product, partial [Allacma fusca]
FIQISKEVSEAIVHVFPLPPTFIPLAAIVVYTNFITQQKLLDLEANVFRDAILVKINGAENLICEFD